MRAHSQILFCLLLSASLLLAACGDDFTETTRGQILVKLADNTSITDTGEIVFDARIPGDPATSEIFLIENSAESGDLTVNSVTLLTSSPYLTLRESNEPVACDALGCTYPEFELAPRNTIQFDVTYELGDEDSDVQCGTPPEGKPSDWCGEIIIESNDQDNEEIRIDLRVPQLSGDMQVCLEGDASCTETRIIFNPATTQDPPQTARFTVENVGSNLLQLVEVTPSLMPANEFSVEGPTPPVSLNPNDIVEYTLTFEAQSDDEMLERSGSILLRSNAGNVVSLSVSVGDARAPLIEVDKEELNFVEVNQGQSETQEITITNAAGAGAGALTVDLNLDPSDTADYAVFDEDGNPRAGGQCLGGSPPMTCTQQIVIPASSSEVISVTYAPQTMEGTNATLRIGSNDLTNNPVEVSLRGNAGVGFAAAMPTALVWENPAMDTPESKTVTVSNEGTVDLTINGLEARNISPAAGESLFSFSVDPSTNPIVLAPSEETTFDVTFTRASDDMIMQEYAGDVVILNDGAGGEVTISVSVTYP